tara:strand:- start:374 stop:778 length:405 start_codon:yes stop_codon:yes gene_type:complete
LLLPVDSLKLRAMKFMTLAPLKFFILVRLVTALPPLNSLEAEENGKRLFLENCAECHKADGQGMADVYPALDNNEVVTGSGIDVALVLIIGRGEMPSFSGSMSAEDMAAVINYIRNAWSNSGELIFAEAIESLQ